MKTKSLEEIAIENGLEIIETTNDRGYYPRDIKLAIIGFDNFKQAEKLAKEYGLSIELFYKEDGKKIYFRTGHRRYEEITVNADDLGDCYSQFNKNDYDKYYENEIAPRLSDFNNLEDLDEFLNKQREIMEQLYIAGDNEIVICRDLCYYDTVREKTMKSYHDGLVAVIGLINGN